MQCSIEYQSFVYIGFLYRYILVRINYTFTRMNYENFVRLYVYIVYITKTNTSSNIVVLVLPVAAQNNVLGSRK